MTNRAEYDSLVDQCLAHRYRYYVLGEPIISDSAYDLAEQELRHIESYHPEWLREDSPTQTVGSDARWSYPTHIQDMFPIQ